MSSSEKPVYMDEPSVNTVSMHMQSESIDHSSINESSNSKVCVEGSSNNGNNGNNSSSDEQQLTMCAVCPEAHPATHQCDDCAQGMCQLMAHAHTRFRPSQSHQIKPLSAAASPISSPPISPRNHINNNFGNNTCNEHNRLRELYDAKCEKLVCVECVVTHHKNHDFHSIADTAKSFRVKIEKLLKKTRSIVTEVKKEEKYLSEVLLELDTFHRQEQTTLKNFFDEIRAAVSEREEVLKKDLEISQREKCLLFTQQAQTIQNFLSKAENIETRAKTVLEEQENNNNHKNDSNIITIRKELSVLLEERPEQKEENNYCLELISERETIFHMLSHIGCVRAQATVARTSKIIDFSLRASHIHFCIQAKDAQNKDRETGGDIFDIEINKQGGGKEGEKEEIHVEDKRNGKYEINGKVKENCVLNVRFKGKHIQGSPIEIQLTEEEEEREEKKEGKGASEERGEKEKIVRVWGESGYGEGQLSNPRGMAVSYPSLSSASSSSPPSSSSTTTTATTAISAGHDYKGEKEHEGEEVFVVSYAKHCVDVFSPKGVFLRSWGSREGGDVQFSYPWGIAVSHNVVFVTEFNNHRVQSFLLDGTPLHMWGGQGGKEGQFSGPMGIAASADEVYVVEQNNSRIQVFRRDGTFLRTWGTHGIGDGQFKSPRGIAVSTKGEVFVSDLGNNRIQVFNTLGVFLRKWGSPGSAEGEFNSPRNIALNAKHDLFVTDCNNKRIQVFAPDGTFLRALDAHHGSSPYAIAVSVTGEVFVTHDTNIVAVFR